MQHKSGVAAQWDACSIAFMLLGLQACLLHALEGLRLTCFEPDVFLNHCQTAT